jgi:hypothetical protein
MSQVGRLHPNFTVYAGLPAFEHKAVLAALSPDVSEARRLHRMCVWLGLISPPAYTSRGGRNVRVQFVHAARIAALLRGEGQSNE